jgi:DNA polymerase III gamma/tau subunit
MADEAFALSPISARAAQPREEDYDAISEAFMETSRGRWFLGEYAKRNRNADTRMVLDAVARIEQSLAAQKQPEPAPVVDSVLPEAIEAIKAALREARAMASYSLDHLALEQHLAPVRKGARVIREISWRWREIGADSRICDLLDSQVGAIEESCGQLATVDPHGGLSAAFDLIARQVAAFDDSDDGVEQAVAESTAAPSPAPSAEGPTAAAEPAEMSASAQTEAEQAVATTTFEAEMDVEAAQANAELSEPASQASEAAAQTEAEITIEAADVTVDGMDDEAAEAQNDAVLDLIAAEMSAADVSDAHLDFDDPEMSQADQQAAQPETIALAAEVAVAPAMAPAIEPAAPAAVQPAQERTPEPEPEPSIGSALVAGGLLAKTANDPLAALRRLSQAEKIALFS